MVTGSRFGFVGYTELYDTNKDVWRELPQMRTSRYYHTSCSFNSNAVYVSCGVSSETKGYLNTIERLDLTLLSKNIV